MDGKIDPVLAEESQIIANLTLIPPLPFKPGRLRTSILIEYVPVSVGYEGAAGKVENRPKAISKET
jgi:hypothetical protein